MTDLKFLVAQINPSRGVGDIAGNTKRLAQIWKQGDENGVDLVLTEEQSLTGYPLEDLARQPDVLWASKIALQKLIELSKKYTSALLVGLPEQENGKIYNSVFLIEKGAVTGKVRKHDLPNDDVFDEKRIYSSEENVKPLAFRNHMLGIMICEDLWHQEVASSLAAQGADVLIVPNASPWHIGKEDIRMQQALTPRILETGLPVLYINQVGGIDELIFDGHSMAINSDGTIAYRAKGFEESLDVITLKTHEGKSSFASTTVNPPKGDLETLWQALTLGLRDYVTKNGFNRVHLGNSGGIDSAVVAALAVDAMGAENVDLYKLPSAYTQSDSNDDADTTATLLGASIKKIDIWPAYEVIQKTLGDHFRTNREDATNANIQARIRGLFLMALSNRNDSLLLSTGNKSEMTVGFATLYGDMNGAFNPIKNVDKMLVYKLAEWRNTHYPENTRGPKGQVIALNTIAKRAKAELGPGNNFDEDVLPPYPILTEVSRRYIEENQSIEQIKDETGYKTSYIEDIIRRTDWSEFKRRQSCPGLKITKRDFGKGYRVPITRPDTITMLKDIRHLKLDI